MATDLEIPQIKPDNVTQATTIDKDSGQNVDTGFTKIKAGESVASTNPSNQSSQTPTRSGFISKFNFNPKYKKPALIAGGVLLFILVFGLLLPGLFVYINAMNVVKSAKAVKASVASKDINKVKAEITKLKGNTSKLRTSYKFLGWLRIVPFVGGYWNDGNAALNGGIYGLEASEVLIDTVAPYADIAGFTSGQGVKSGGENAESRIEFIVETIDDIIPKFPAISAKVISAQKEFSKINPNRYPEKFGKKEVRGKIVEALNIVDDAARVVTDAKPLLEQAPYLLGIDEERTYLLIFQNDKELRPTGGFITAYSIMKVNKGKLNNVSSDDIYNLDTKYKPSVPAPQPIVDYIKGPYIQSQNLRLRDMNFDPDFKVSMDLFHKEAEDLLQEDIDGIIAVDTHVLVKILNVVGEIGVPGFGNFSTKIVSECNCPQVIYELESFADVEGPIIWDPVTGKIILRPPNSDNRKRIVGPLMNSVLSNAMGQPKEKIPALFQAAYESLTEKHVLFYMLEDKVQSASETFNIAGRIKEYNGDYLHINDSNLGGRKSNLYVTQEVSQDIKVARDGSIEKTVTITYKNPEKHDGWLNSVLPNWVRIYVPKGSTLIDMAGVENKKDPYEEYGKTVYAGYFELRPQGVAKVTLTYKLPFKAKDMTDAKHGTYNLMVQKQPGTDMPLYSIKLGKKEEESFLKTDKEFRLKL